MQPPPLLLCISSNPDLRETRRRVLLTRYRVIAIGSLPAMEALTYSAAFHLLIVCHTLSAQERAAAICSARQNWPGIKVLGISAPYANPFLGDADAVIGGLAGPHAMFNAIEQLLASPAANHA